METKDEEMNPKESIALIQKMIGASRKQFAQNGAHMVLWAIVLIVAALVNYMLLFTNLDNSRLSFWVSANWIALPVLGGILSFFVGRRQAEQQVVETHVGWLLKYMWIGFGITLFFVIFFSLNYGHSSITFILLLTGFATFIYGLGVRYTPFIIGSVCYWLLGIAAFFVIWKNQLLIFALAIVLGYLIPGLMLYKKVKRQNA